MGLDIPTPAQPEKGAETDELSDELSDAELDEQPGEALDAELIDPDEESDAEMTLRSAAEAMRDLFDQLDPPDTIEVFDPAGNSYICKSALPARGQIRVVRQLETLLQVQIDGDDIQTRMQGGFGAIAEALVQLASSETVLTALANAFEAAHPGVVAQANQKLADETGTSASDAADLFAAEELVAGLVPFLARSGARLPDLVAQLMGSRQSE